MSGRDHAPQPLPYGVGCGRLGGSVGYELVGVVGGGELLGRVARGLAGARVVALRQGLGLVPMTDELFDAVTDGGASEFAELWKLPGGFGQVLGRWSETGAVAYVEAEYFGGVGRQAAVVWVGGTVALGPLTLGEREPAPPAGSPISRALRLLGVVAGPGEDEFRAAGLHRHRRTDDWVAPTPTGG